MVQVNTAAGMFMTSIELENAVEALARRRARLQVSAAGRSIPHLSLLTRLAGHQLDLASPRVGDFWVAGPLADSIAASLRDPSTDSGPCALCVGLDRVGVPPSARREYEEALACGQSILFTYGDADEIARTVDVLSDAAHAVRLHVGCRWAA